MDGNSTAACDEAYDLVARYRAAAFGKTDRQIMDSLDHDAALAVFVDRQFIAHVLDII